MRAILQSGYGSVDELQLGEIARPEPADDEVLIQGAGRIGASGCVARRGRPTGACSTSSD